MKILAIEKETEGVIWNSLGELLKEEVRHVYDLYLADKIREIYFTEHKNALLILETKDKKEALKILSSLPLVKAGMIKFEILELKPYTGLERIMHQL
ncbi:MAG: superoxide dismutase [Bacteroidetes bacterium]|nr:superoxide dismutase [Bacteroidota bacterium]